MSPTVPDGEWPHLLTVLVVVAGATGLRVAGDIDITTLSVIYGAALGYPAGRAGKPPTNSG